MIFLLTTFLLGSISVSGQNETFHLYDDLRSSGIPSTPLFENTNRYSSYVGRNLHRVEVPSDDNKYGGHQSLVFCHVPTFLRYSNGPDCTIAYAASAGAMLAMHHFNTGNGIVVPELEDIHKKCGIRLTTEIVDTGSSPISAVSSMIRMLTRSSDSFAAPQPCAVFGSQISSVTSKLASLTGVFNLFQVSSSAMATELDNDVQYPLLARSHTDNAGFGKMSISYLKFNLNISSFGILVPNDSYGLSFQQSILEEAAQYDMNSISSSYLPTLTSQEEFEEEIRRSLQLFKDSRQNYFIAAFYPEMLETIMSVAGEMGLAGPGKFWLMSGTADTAPYVLSGKFVIRKDSNAAKAIAGGGMIFCKGGLPGVGGSYDSFTNEWKKLGQTPESLEYVNSKQPIPIDGGEKCSKSSTYFQNFPHHIVTFSYDAIVALGLSACKAAKRTINATFSSKEHRNIFAYENEFRGASGDFTLRENFPTRTADSSYFVMVNMKINDFNESHIYFRGSPVSFFWETNQSKWEKFGNKEFLYADGTSTAPEELAPLPDDENGKISFLPIAISLFVTISVIIGAFIYVKRKRSQADSIWSVKISELAFDDPTKVIGRGTFGVVLLAQYRGTEVAIKRVIPPKQDDTSNEDVFNSTDKLIDIETGTKREVHFEEDALDNDEFLPNRVRSNTYPVSDTTRNGSNSSQNYKRNTDTSQTIGGGSTNSVLVRSKSRSHIIPKIFTTLRGQNSYVTLRKDFIREMKLLSKLRHPCITTVMGAVLDDVHEPMLIMEYMNHGSLQDILHNMTISLDSEIVLPILRDISQGVRFLHSAEPPVIHGDLKSANVLVDSKFRAKVSDFGLSQKKKMGVSGTPFWMGSTGASGTPYWMAPELLRGESDNTTASDVYSFGMILYEVMSRKNPYEGEKYEEVIKGIIDPKVHKRPPIPSTGPAQIHSLMTDCFVDRPEDRPSLGEIDGRLKRLDAELIDSGDLPIHSLQKKKDHTTRTNQLLFDVFPQHIAEALRDGRKVEPTVCEVVTIFFSDIVGFTNISSLLTPMKISDMLDRLYNKFDDLSHKHDIFKVETIGDAYMAVTNLVKDQHSDHVKRIADFSVDAMMAAKETLIDVDDPEKGYVNIRIGFHSGPVVANVVGSRNPRYCLFGDTVNTASRMESNSKANRIHCSEHAAQYLGEQHPTMPIIQRGWINVKGKGEMKTFWVNECHSGDGNSTARTK